MSDEIWMRRYCGEIAVILVWECPRRIMVVKVARSKTNKLLKQKGLRIHEWEGC